MRSRALHFIQGQVQIPAPSLGSIQIGQIPPAKQYVQGSDPADNGSHDQGDWGAKVIGNKPSLQVAEGRHADK